MSHTLDYFYYVPYDKKTMSDWFILCDDEYAKYLKRDFPVKNNYGNLFWLDENNFIHREDNKPAIIWVDRLEDYYVHGKLHRIDGAALRRSSVNMYFIDGGELSEVEFVKATRKRFYFLREKIICLKKLTEIPELFQEVYYSRKGEFISLLKKL